MPDIDINDLVLFIVYHSHRICNPSWHIQDHILNCVDTTYIIKGSAEYTIDGVKYLVSSGDLVCTQKGSRKSAVTFPDDLMECFSVSGSVTDINNSDVPMPLPTVSHIGVHQDIINMYKNLYSEWIMREPGYMLKTRAMYMMIIQKLYVIVNINKNDINFDKRIKKALRYITEHYDKQLTISDVAGTLGLNKQYFGNLFKSVTGQTFRQYLTMVRVNCAENLLSNGDLNVNEVAEACGFANLYYFSKVFKENRGYSPSQVILSTGLPQQ